MLKENLDYVTNTQPPTFPDGLDVSAISFKALQNTWQKPNQISTKNTYYLHPKKKKFQSFNYSNSENLSLERWTVDESEDLVVIKNILKRFKNLNFSWKDVIKLKKNKPELFWNNSNFLRDEGSINGELNPGQLLWKRAKKIIPGGNMLLSKRPQLFLPNKWPTYFKKAKGCNVTGIDNINYLDCSTMGIGTNILGYGHPKLTKPLRKLLKGNMSTFNCPEEVCCLKNF